MDALKCLNEESLFLLNKHQLIQRLIKSELIHEKLSKVSLDNSLKEKTISEFKISQGITDDEKYKEWLKKNNLSPENLEHIALSQIRMKKYSKTEFGHKINSWFLERKDHLDIVVYSMIRVKDPYLSRELYLRIISKEEEFGELASIHSEGIEKKTRGIVGPTSLGQSHPKLAEVLKTSKKGKVNEPFRINENYIVTRLESYDPAELDSYMQEKMGEELFINWIDKKVIELENELYQKPFNSNNENLS